MLMLHAKLHAIRNFTLMAINFVLFNVIDHMHLKILSLQLKQNELLSSHILKGFTQTVFTFMLFFSFRLKVNLENKLGAAQ